MMRSILWFLTLTALITACVPTKKYVLLQKNDLGKKDLKTDSVLRSYQLSNYKIQPQDQLSVNVEPLLPMNTIS